METQTTTQCYRAEDARSIIETRIQRVMDQARAKIDRVLMRDTQGVG